MEDCSCRKPFRHFGTKRVHPDGVPSPDRFAFRRAAGRSVFESSCAGVSWRCPAAAHRFGRTDPPARRRPVRSDGPECSHHCGCRHRKCSGQLRSAPSDARFRAAYRLPFRPSAPASARCPWRHSRSFRACSRSHTQWNRLREQTRNLSGGTESGRLPLQ